MATSQSEVQTPGAVAKQRQSRRKTWALIVAAIFLLAWGGHWVYQRSIHVYIEDARIDGEIITMSSRVSGWIVELPVIEGDAVKQDQLLVRIDDRDPVLQREVLVSKLKAIEAQMAVMRAQTGQVDQETQGRYQSETSRLAAAEATAASLSATLKQAQDDYARMKNLEKYVSGQEIEYARTALRQAQEQHRKALSEIAAALGSQSAAGGSRRQLNVIEQQLLVLVRQADEMRAEIKRREIDISDRTLSAPANGKVVMTFVRKGEHVSAGQRILMFHNPEETWVEANIKETDVGRIKLGMSARVHVDAYPGTDFKGEVFRIGQAATNRFALLPDPNPSGNFTKITQRLPIRIKLLEGDARLRPGMMVEIYIATGNN